MSTRSKTAKLPTSADGCSLAESPGYAPGYVERLEVPVKVHVSTHPVCYGCSQWRSKIELHEAPQTWPGGKTRPAVIVPAGLWRSALAALRREEKAHNI